MSSVRTHTGTRWTLSVHSEHIYKDNIWVATSVGRNDCAKLRCATKFALHRETSYDSVRRLGLLRQRKNKIVGKYS